MQPIQISVGESLSLTLVMAVGGVAEEVSVSAGRPVVHTASAGPQPCSAIQAAARRKVAAHASPVSAPCSSA